MNYISLLRRVASAGALLVGLGAAQEARAATFTVTSTSDSGAGSLRQAVLDANSAASDDTILFAPSTFATSTFPRPTIALTTGSIEVANNGKLAINGLYTGQPLQGRGSNSSGDNRIFKINAGANLTLSNFSIGSASANGSNGGAITNDGTLTLNSCYFSSNSANNGLGGAIFNSGGGTLMVNNCNFSINSAEGGAGGAIANSGTATINATTFSSNQAFKGSGGAISSRGGTLSIRNSSFSTNTTNSGSGGALSNTEGSVTIEGSTFDNNFAGQGVGGAITNSSSLTARNSTFYSNYASEGRGGALYNTGGSSVIESSTFTLNGGDNGAGIFSDNAVLTLNNSIVANNRASTGPNISGTVTSGDYNLVDDVAGATLSGSHNITGKPANLRYLEDNGGPTKTCTLEANSPAIDAGNSSLTTDQRGQARPVDVVSIPNASGGNGSDIGAVEVVDTPQSFSTASVNTTDDHDDGVCGVVDCSLREAIIWANGSSGVNAIGFGAAVFTEKKVIALTTPLPPITAQLVIAGPVFNETNAGLTLRDTSTQQNGFLFVSGTSLTVSNLTFADTGGSAISLSGSQATVKSCTFSNCNYGIQNGNNPSQTNTLSVENSTFVGCTDAALLNGGNNSTSSTATVKSCTFTDNAYGISVQAGTVNLSNSLVVGNRTANIFTDGGTLSGDHNITSGSAAEAGLDPAGLKDNGGATPTVALVAGGAAVDAGNSTLTTDQRGFIRPFDFSAVTNASDSNGSDIGAFELNETPQSGTTFVVNRTDDHDDSVCGPTDCTLREAINAANADADASTITFDATVFASKSTIVIANGTNLPIITRDVTLRGPSAPGVGVTIQKLGTGQCLRVQYSTALISNLTLSGGQFGLYIFGASVTMTGCTITGTSSSGIVNSGKPLTVNNSTIAFNAGSGIATTISAVADVASSSIVANGGQAFDLTNSGTINLSNSLVVGNQRNVPATDSIRIFNDNGNNITSGTLAEAGLDAGGLKDNGGPTPTIALVAGSPAINAGATSLATDQRGVARDRKPDIGAFEFPNTAPGFASITPQDVTDKVGIKRTFNLTVVDAEGARDISEVWLLINERLSWNAGATLIYVPSTSSPTSGLLYLRKGDAFLAPIQVGEGASSSAVLDNGTVRVVASEVLITASGNVVRMSLPLTIRDGLVGNNRIFGRVVDRAGATDPASLAGDDGYIRFGTYTVTPQFSGGANSAPILSRLTPGATTTTLNSSGIASAPQTFSFAVKDDNGSGDLESVWFLAGKQRNWTGSATFIYQPRSRRLYLRSDDGNSFLGGGVIGTSGILENSQVRLDLSKVKTTIYPDGKTVGLSLPLQAKSGLVGQNKVWLRAQDNNGATAPNGDAQGYVLSGTWNVTQSTTPNSANGLSAGNS